MPTVSQLSQAVELHSSPESAFALVCQVEKWPVWLSFLRSARLVHAKKPIGIGAEVMIRSRIPGEADQLFEVDQYIEHHVLSLVGAYSVRRRLDFRIERKTTRSKLVARLDYPAYGGRIASLMDRLTARRKLAAQLAESLVHFKGLVEFDRHPDAVLADF
ncbi:MAG: hypothetical protein DLM50_09740 [Candidatus Meridianibacter frigidus]|nr:MAG: hypothetical protein DLM50_09740 [Candidatus Eremiobacteraeota bacterium]